MYFRNTRETLSTLTNLNNFLNNLKNLGIFVENLNLGDFEYFEFKKYFTKRHGIVLIPT